MHADRDTAKRMLSDRYRLDQRIGAGGMGEVWHATDLVLGRPVAVKLMLATLLADPGFERRFLFEARAMAAVRHPGIVAIHDYRSGPEGAYLVMELVDGESLATLLRRMGRLRPADTMNLVAQAADALQGAHEQGLVHRDVKPGNLLVRTDGTLVLTDFGIARALGASSVTTKGEVLGTPSYLAPEQVLGKSATPLSDVYSLGVVAFECLAGRRPFEADSPYGVAVQRLQESPPALGPDIPVAVARVVGAALARAPEDRWPSAADFAAAARRAAYAPHDTGISVPATGVSPSTGDGIPTPLVVRASPGSGAGRADGATMRRRRRNQMLAAGAALAVLVGAAVWATVRGALEREGAAGTTNGAVVSGFVRCGPVLCPAKPMCWSGLNAIGGRSQPPTPVECTVSHPWETYAAATMPADALEIRQDELLARRPDVEGACSVDRMRDRSHDGAATAGFAREPWPVEIDAGVWIFHCLAGPGVGEVTGSHFRSGA
jgi:serine/threonine-protein kinase